MAILKRYMNHDTSSPYLFPLLNSREGTKEAYHEYQLALRNFNRQLMLLGEMLGLGISSVRILLAIHGQRQLTIVKFIRALFLKLWDIRQSTVTETYLKPFRNKKIDEANKKVVDFIKHSMLLAIC